MNEMQRLFNSLGSDFKDTKYMKSPLRYPGGKSKIAYLFLPHIPAHYEYRELFAGGAGIFFAKAPAKVSWLNDLHPGVYAFYKTLRDHFDEFMDYCFSVDVTKLQETFYDYSERRDLMDAKNDDRLVERGFQYYLLNRVVFAGRVCYDPHLRSRLFFSNPNGWKPNRLYLKHCSNKLQGVQITNLPYHKCMADCDKETFIYLDPPYFRELKESPTSRLYEKSFKREDHISLKMNAERSDANVMISYDRCADITTMYAQWHIHEFSLPYVSRHVIANEILITNY